MKTSTELDGGLPEERPGSEPLIANLTAGLLIGLLQIFLALSFAALIFSGQLAGFLPRGIGLALIGMIITGLVIAAFTSLPGTLGGSQGVPAAIMAVMAAAIAAEVPAGGSSTESFITVAVAIALVAMASGVFFWILGHFRLGGLVRFLPYPVVGGFLAGTGWLFLTGATGMMVDAPFSFAGVPALFEPQTLIRWLPGLILALVMLVVTRRSDHFLILPAFLIGSLLLFFGVAWILGYSPAELSADGWLLGPFAEGEGRLWQPLTPADLTQVDWAAISNQAANIVAVMAVSAISLLLNAGGLELATDRDMEVDHELQVAGVANILAGLAGGLVGYKQLSLSTLNFKLGGNSRLPGYVAAAVCVVILIAGSSLLSIFPKVIVGSLLLLLGLNFLFEWVIEGSYKLPRVDYLIVLVILFVTMAAGFLQAVALGLLLAVILFVVSYSQVNVVRHELDGGSFQSRVSRSRKQLQLLQQHGDHLYILQLQGFIFFGTANNLLDRLRARFKDSDQQMPGFVVLDFLRVTGLDSTAMLSFTRMLQLAEKEGVTLVFTEPNEQVLYQLQQGGLNDDGRLVRIFPSLDHGVEWCENNLLDENGGRDGETDVSLLVQLEDLLRSGRGPQVDQEHLQALLAHFEVLELDSGQTLITMGEKPDDIYFIDSGQVTAQLARPDRPPVRLETSGSGSVIGEIGFYLGEKRTADVVADAPGKVYRLSMDELQKLEKRDPELASTLHQIVVYLLAERVVHLTNSVKALER